MRNSSRSAGDGTRGNLRRLITLISAGRNRIVMIRRELPRTENAGWVGRPYRTEHRRILLAVFSRSVTCAAAGMSIPKSLLAGLAERHRWDVHLQNLSKLVGRELVGLNLIRQMNHIDRGEL